MTGPRLERPLSKLKPGDEVWLCSDGFHARYRKVKVKKVTSTYGGTISIEGDKIKYQTSNGWARGDHHRAGILKVETPELLAEIDEADRRNSFQRRVNEIREWRPGWQSDEAKVSAIHEIIFGKADK